MQIGTKNERDSLKEIQLLCELEKNADESADRISEEPWQLLHEVVDTLKPKINALGGHFSDADKLIRKIELRLIMRDGEK